MYRVAGVWASRPAPNKEEMPVDDNQRSAFLISQSACAIVKALGMISENLQRINCGDAIAYNYEAFNKLINEHAIGWNDAISFLQGR